MQQRYGLQYPYRCCNGYSRHNGNNYYYGDCCRKDVNNAYYYLDR